MPGLPRPIMLLYLAYFLMVIYSWKKKEKEKIDFKTNKEANDMKALRHIIFLILSSPKFEPVIVVQIILLYFIYLYPFYLPASISSISLCLAG